MLPHLQQVLHAALVEKCPQRVEGIIYRTVPSTVESPVHHSVALFVANMVSAHVEHQFKEAFTVLSHSPLGLDLVGIIESVVKRRSRNSAVSEAVRGTPCVHLADRPFQVYYTGSETLPLGQVDEAAHRERSFVYLPPILGVRNSPHGGANEEERSGIIR